MFRRLSKPCLRVLPLLWVVWLLVTCVLVPVIYGLSCGWRDLIDAARHFPLLAIGLLLLYGSPVAVVLGSGHYVVLRWMGKRTEAGSGKWDFLSALTLTCVMLGALGFFHWKHRIDMRLRRDIWSREMEVYETLARAGQHEELVRKMENACARFSHAKQELDDEDYGYAGNHGFSHLFVYLYPAWYCTRQLAPPGVLAFLQDVRHDRSSGYGGYGPWRPIADAVSQSETPILRVLGCFMVGDDPGFVDAAYALADSDPDAIPLAAFASLRDTDPARSVKRILQYQACGGFKDMDSDGRIDEFLRSYTAKALDAATLDESLKSQLRKQPWVRKLSLPHQQALGLEGND